jgi:hypothetical protein
MRRFILATLALTFLVLALACSGGSGSASSGPSNPPPPPPPAGNPQPVAVSHYTSTPKAQPVFFGSQGTMAPIFIVGPGGDARGELDGYIHLKTALAVAPDGTLVVGTDGTLINPDGTTQPLTLTGSLVNGVLSGTANGHAFSMTLNTSMDAPVTLAQAVGTYVSSVTSNGLWGRFTVTIPATDPNTGQITGKAYATQADALAETNPLGRLEGTLSYADGDPQHLHNVWNIGLAYYGPGSSTAGPLITYGLAAFSGNDLISLSANTLSPAAGQWSGIFARQ